MPAVRARRYARLENTTTRKAFYEITLEETEGGAFRVKVSFGKLGHNPIKTIYTGEMIYARACGYFDGKLKDKVAGGYVVKEDTVPTGTSLPAAAPETEDLPEKSIFKDDSKEANSWSKIKERRKNDAPWGSG